MKLNSKLMKQIITLVLVLILFVIIIFASLANIEKRNNRYTSVDGEIIVEEDNSKELELDNIESNVAKPSDIKPTESNSNVTMKTKSEDYGLIADLGSQQNSEMYDMLSSDVEVITLSKGTYEIDDTLNITSGVAKRIVGEEGTIISVKFSSSKVMFNLSVNIAFENITFDFNDGYLFNGLSYEENIGTIFLKDLVFQNIRDENDTTGTTIINIATFGNKVNIEDLIFSNIYKKGNGVIGEGAGNVTCVYIASRQNEAGVNGYVKDIEINEVHNIDSKGDVLFEDTSGIYAISNYRGTDSNLLIEGIRGFNAGKRLIKIDASNIVINNVVSECDTLDQLGGIGINSGSNIDITNVSITGESNFGIALYGNDIRVSNVYINLDRNYWDNAFGFVIGGYDIEITDFDISAGRCILFNNRNKRISNINISKGTMNVKKYGTHAIHYLDNSKGFNNISLSDIDVFYHASASNMSGFFSGIIFSDIDEGNMSGFYVSNCSLTADNGDLVVFSLTNVDDILIDGFEFINLGQKQGNEFITLTDSNDVKLNNIIINSKFKYPIHLVRCDNVDISDIYSLTPQDVVHAFDSNNMTTTGIDGTIVPKIDE